MTNNNHPITPPLELMQQWISKHYGTKVDRELGGVERTIATQAARWGADQELEACCEAFEDIWDQEDVVTLADFLRGIRAARRPKPPSLKEQALGALENLNGECLLEGFECPEKVAIIRRAIESLPD